MSTIDLVILGLLKSSPAGAYELAQKVENSRMNKIIKIGSPTIYQNIKKLAKKDYLASQTVKEGEMPEKAIYTLTHQGEAYFMDLMWQMSANPGRIYFNFNGFIKNLALVKKETGLDMLNKLKLYFYDTREDLERDINMIASPPFEIRVILKQYQIMLKGMIQWVEVVIEEYQNEGSLDD